MMSIPDDSAAVAGMFKLTRPGGLVAMSFPYNEHRSVANVYELPDAGYGQDFRFKCKLYSRADIDRWISEQQAELVLQERYRVFSGELWTMGHRVVPTVTGPDEPHHFTTVVLRKPPAAQSADAPS
jgi:hypothetical protein